MAEFEAMVGKIDGSDTSQSAGLGAMTKQFFHEQALDGTMMADDSNVLLTTTKNESRGDTGSSSSSAESILQLSNAIKDILSLSGASPKTKARTIKLRLVNWDLNIVHSTLVCGCPNFPLRIISAEIRVAIGNRRWRAKRNYYH